MRKHFFLFFLIGLIACKKEVELNQNSKISKITTGNGPEDIIIDESISPARILVSCSARRDNQTENGEIYQLNCDNDSTSILPRIGEPHNFVFNPHGIDIYKNGDESFLYVISHYAIDSVDVIAKYKIQPDRLVFEQYFTNPIMVSANAISVLPNGSFYVTNDDGGGDIVYEQLFNQEGGSIVYCNLENKWKKVANKLRFPNGLANKNSILYVATSRNKALFTFDINADNTLSNKTALNQLDGQDNLRWNGNDLLVSVHPNQLKFAINAFNPNTISPIQSYSIDIVSGKKKLLFEDNGNIISSASTTLIYNGNLYLAQIFDPFVLKVKL